jgi:hypothetical protein
VAFGESGAASRSAALSSMPSGRWSHAPRVICQK